MQQPRARTERRLAGNGLRFRLLPETGLAVRPIIDAVERLPESQRTALPFVSVDGLGDQQAADTLDIPIDTIMSGISRACKVIQIVFGGSGESRMETGHRIDA